MIDGILDLLIGILVLGVVLVIAFSFLFPLLSNDLMHYDSQYQDKAIMTDLAYQDDFTSYTVETIKRYNYKELMLLLAIQDDRMEKPKKINIRNLLSDPREKIGIWNIDLYELKNLNLNLFNNLEYIKNNGAKLGIQHYADNHLTHFGGGIWNQTTLEHNVGTITLSSQYSDNVNMLLDEMIAIQGTNLDIYTDYYYIDYQYALPNDLNLVANNPEYQVNFDEEPLYMIHVSNESIGLDTKEIYEDNILNPVKEELIQYNSGKKE